MATIDWNSNSLRVKDILEGFLAGIIDVPVEEATKVKNSLARAIYEIAMTTAIEDTHLIDLVSLDEYGIVGKTLEKLWNLCEKDKDYFKKTVSYISGNIMLKCFSQYEIVENLALDKPIPFIPNNEAVHNFHELVHYNDAESLQDIKKIIYSLRLNLVSKINEARKDDVDFTSLPEPIYNEEEETPEMAGNIPVHGEQLYFGLNTLDLTGGVLGINCQFYGLFERSLNTVKMNGKSYYILREIPSGEISVIDEYGQLQNIEEPVEYNGNSLLPSKKYVQLQIASLRTILKDANKQFIQTPIVEKCADITKSMSTVEECKKIIPELVDLYSTLYGGLDNNKKL